MAAPPVLFVYTAVDENEEMVSTRGLKFKFSEGERVLCYEPDPTKAKVLYESKVLEVCVSKDGKGRKIPEYLIHFNGWSSSWDRCVTEEFVLKDNDDNRGLQKRLAEAASLNLIHPIRKKTKKKKKRRFSDVIKESLSTTTTSSSKKRVSATTEDEESEDNNNWRDRVSGGGGGGSRSGAESNAGSHSTCSSTADGSEDEDDAKQMDLELPDILKKKLEEVHHLIKQKNKLLSLPSTPNVISILEGYVKNYSANAFCITPEKPKAVRNQIQAEKNVSLCKEVMDGIRIYFDFTLPILLLYEEERAQYAYWMDNFKPAISIKEEPKQSVNVTTPKIKQSENESETCSDSVSTKVKGTPSNDELSPRSIKPQKIIKRGDHCEEVTSEVGYPRRVLRSTAGRLEVAAKMSPSRPPYDCQPPLFLSDEEQQGTTLNKSKECKTAKCGRSQKQRPNCRIQIPSSPSPPQIASACSPPSLSALDSSSPPFRRKHPPPLIIPSHISSSSSSRSGPTTPTAGVTVCNPPHVVSDVSEMIDRTMTWQMIPRSVYLQVPPPPSLIYGAHHLSRLFVKMPEMLTRTNISDYKLSTIHGHLELFLKYLVDCQEDLFTGEEIANDYVSVVTSSQFA